MTEIEVLIRESLEELLKLESISESKGLCSGKLVFPTNRIDKKKRISEQEARFLLVKQLETEKQIKFQYAVEIPTMRKYSFSGKGERSGNIDLCIYCNGKRSNLIEFKALNPQKSSYTKDFEKLFFDYIEDEDNELINFFIQVLGTKNLNIEKKLNEAIKESITKHSDIYKSKVIVFVCTLENKEIKKYKVEDNKLKIDSE